MDLSTKKVSYHTNQIYAICQDVHAAEFPSLANEIIHVDVVIGARLRHFSRSITSTQNMLHLWRIFRPPYSRPSRRLSFWIWCSSMSCGVIQNRLSDGWGDHWASPFHLWFICYYYIASNASLWIFLFLSKLITCAEIYHWMSTCIIQTKSSYCGTFFYDGVKPGTANYISTGEHFSILWRE